MTLLTLAMPSPLEVRSAANAAGTSGFRSALGSNAKVHPTHRQGGRKLRAGCTRLGATREFTRGVSSVGTQHVDDIGAVSEIVAHDIGAGALEIGAREAPGGDAERACPVRATRADIVRRVADDPDLARVEFASDALREPLHREPNEIGAMTAVR